MKNFMTRVTRIFNPKSPNLLIVGALDPALLESMTIVSGTRKDSIEGEEGKTNDLCTIILSRLILQKGSSRDFTWTDLEKHGG